AFHDMGAELLVEPLDSFPRGNRYDTTSGLLTCASCSSAPQSRRTLVLLLVHVGNVEALDRRPGEHCHRAFRLVGVDVHPKGSLIAHNQHGVAERFQLWHERRHFEEFTAHDEVRAVAKAARLVRRVVNLRRCVMRHLGKLCLLSAKTSDESGYQKGDAIATSIDHAVLAEHG